MDVQMLSYIHSENEFNRASHRAFWEVVRSLFTHHSAYPVSFNEATSKLDLNQSADRGLQDIPVKKIIGSAGRCRDFTRHFLPRLGDKRNKERWRNIYTLAVTGKGVPPVEVYKVGNVYFVEDGHHRVSVARHLEWSTIQAYVTEILIPPTCEPDFFTQLGWGNEVHLQN